jgi:hypothetical protein
MWSGSQDAAFEELCAQLAALEPMPDGVRFTRKAPPDSGVECFWTLADDSEIAWQAKFFRAPLGDSQWQQLDESVTRAIERHPKLMRYVVCLPRDREDPRTPKKKSTMERWNERVVKWEKQARALGREVRFEYWGTHELALRLARDEHRGRRYYFFQEEVLSAPWFQRHLDVAISNAGARYTAELNVELPIARVFDGLCRSAAFQDRLLQHRRTLREEVARTAYAKIDEMRDGVDTLTGEAATVLRSLEAVEGDLTRAIDFEAIGKGAKSAAARAWSLEEQVDTLVAKNPTSRYEYDGTRHHLRRVSSAASDIATFTESAEARAANALGVMLRGEAGTGKTHLLCDVTSARVRAGLPSIVLLGEQFVAGEPWSQILGLLGLTCTRDEFLGALEAAAQAAGGRALIAIDAVNESAVRSMWRNHLAGMLTILSSYPHVRFALSVRTPYEKDVVPDQLRDDRLVRTTHMGFRGHEYQATRTFFGHYGIKRPAVPLLNPEFDNPLFLKLLCEGLRKAGFVEVPPGFHGISTVFQFFVEKTNERLAGADQLDFDPTTNLVQRAIDALADKMVESDERWLKRDVAKKIVDAIHHGPSFEHSLFRRLIVEGVLAEDRICDDVSNARTIDAVRFTYERLADHLIVRRLLDRHVIEGNPAAAFTADAPLGKYIRDNTHVWQRGLISALCIQVPERFSLELPDLVPEEVDSPVMRDAFIESIMWRLPTAFTKRTKAYVNDHVLAYEDTAYAFFDAVLTVATNPDHPYNARFLHGLLSSYPMAERDAWWSIYLHRVAETEGAVARLVEWGRDGDDKSHLDDKSLLLAAVALAWFFTCSDRALRDGATKALVALLTPRAHLVSRLLALFKDVDDLYVQERLHAAAYGCVMRSTDMAAISALAQHVYDSIFRDGSPPVHLLLRDYARGIVEVALARRASINVDKKRIRPPYGSPWPSMPTAKDVESLTKTPSDSAPKDEWARVGLRGSIMDGDFGRYIIGTNNGIFEWSPDRLTGEKALRPKDHIAAFEATLTPRQVAAVVRYLKTKREAAARSISDILEKATGDHDRTEEVTRSERAMHRALGKKKTAIFQSRIAPALARPNEEPRFDLKMAQRWVLNRVYELGWTVERFGRFDRTEAGRGDIGRHGGKSERIGKKYQWIAWHEFLAYVADNFRYDHRYGDRGKKYLGPWQVGARDIDPSAVIHSTGLERWRGHSKSWWFTVPYAGEWRTPGSASDWVRRSDDLPSAVPLLDITRPDGTKALVLNGYFRWDEPVARDVDRHEVPHRELWYMVRSYIVKTEHLDEVFKWAVKQNFYGDWMPKMHYPSGVFLGEFYWAPSFAANAGRYYGRPSWTTGDRDVTIPHPVLPASDQYFWESSGYDASIEDTIDIELPCAWLTKSMKLGWYGTEGRFFDDSGTLIAEDPSVNAPGPGALVVTRDPLLAMLRTKGYSILWTVLGEKQDFSGDAHGGLTMSVVSGAFRIENNRVVGELRLIPDTA